MARAGLKHGRETQGLTGPDPHQVETTSFIILDHRAFLSTNLITQVPNSTAVMYKIHCDSSPRPRRAAYSASQTPYLDFWDDRRRGGNGEFL